VKQKMMIRVNISAETSDSSCAAFGRVKKGERLSRG
jgi:hypothetical protein